MLTSEGREQRAPRPSSAVSSWSDQGSREALDLLTSTVAELVGFEVAVISTVRDDNVMIVSVGGTSTQHANIVGTTMPTAAIIAEFERANDWGRWRFVPAERIGPNESPLGWVPDMEVSDVEGAWHPYDLLVAPLHGEWGQLIGTLSIDLPMNRLRPSLEQRDMLNKYAAQAERALRMAVQRHGLAERTRLAETARRIVGVALANDDPHQVLEQCRGPLREGFRADDVVVRIYDSANTAGFATDRVARVSPEVLAGVRSVVTRAWRHGRTHMMGVGLSDPTFSSASLQRDLLEQCVAQGITMVLLVPIGAGSECLGHLVMGRRDPDFRFTADERASALSVARDIGQSLMNQRILAHEQSTVAHLREIAEYKNTLLSTVSHELKNPLAAIIGQIEMLEPLKGTNDHLDHVVAKLERASQRMHRVVDDLLTLSRVDDNALATDGEEVDLAPLVREVVDSLRDEAERRGCAFVVHLASRQCVSGRPEDFQRLVLNLVSNAVKYTLQGGDIAVDLRDVGDDVLFSVTDPGIGISEADVPRLFTEFFRSTNPRAVAQPGTGLGLIIAARVAERAGGRIQVESTLNVGSTFRVVLPAAELAF